MGNQAGGNFSYPQVRDLAERNDLFELLCGFGSDRVGVGPAHALEPTLVAWVSGRYYDTLGLIAAGRPPLDTGRRRAGRGAGGGDQRCLLDAAVRPDQ